MAWTKQKESIIVSTGVVYFFYKKKLSKDKYFKMHGYVPRFISIEVTFSPCGNIFNSLSYAK